MEEIDLKDLLKMFWSKRWQISIIILVCMLIGILYTTFMVTPVYTSYTTLVLVSSNSNNQSMEQQITNNDITLNSKLVETYSVLIKSKNIIRQVKNNLNLEMSEDAIRNSIKVSSEKNTEVIRIEVTCKDNVLSKNIANETARVFMGEVKNMYKIENVKVVDVAEVSDDPSNVNPVKDIIIFTLIGIVLSCMYVFIANMLDTTVKTAEEIESNYKVPVLVSIPTAEEIIVEENKKKKRNRTSNRVVNKKGGRR